MPKIEICATEGSTGIRVCVDGVAVPHVRRVTCSAGVEKASRVTLEIVNATVEVTGAPGEVVWRSSSTTMSDADLLKHTGYRTNGEAVIGHYRFAQSKIEQLKEAYLDEHPDITGDV